MFENEALLPEIVALWAGIRYLGSQTPPSKASLAHAPSIAMAELRAAMMKSDDWAANGPYRKAMDVLDGALRLWDPDQIALSFNGGKDAVVLLHLVRAAVAGTPWGSEPGARSCIRCVYFEEDTFDEVKHFIGEMEESFSLKIERFDGGDLKAGYTCPHRGYTPTLLVSADVCCVMTQPPLRMCADGGASWMPPGQVVSRQVGGLAPGCHHAPSSLACPHPPSRLLLALAALASC